MAANWRILAGAAGLGLVSFLAPWTWHAGQRAPARQPLAAAEVAPPKRESTVAFTAHRTPLEPREVALPPTRVAPGPATRVYGPVAADDIDLDPSVTQSPSLPQTSGDQSVASQPQAGPITEPLPEPDRPAALAWPYAAGLVEQLTTLAMDVPASAAWVGRIKDQLHALASLPALDDPAAAAIIARLDALADEGKQLASSLPGDDSRTRVLRAGFSVVRRIVVWQQVHQLAQRGDVAVAPVIDRASWENTLADVDRRLEETGAAENWRKYLLIDRARDEFDSPSCTPTEQRKLARDILYRLHFTQLSHAQEEYLRSPPFVALAQQLLRRASETPDIIELLAAIERHEDDGLADEATALADRYDQLRWSPDPGVKQLAETVNAYYRNANVRVALSSVLVNRLLPRTRQQYEPVQDTIQEAWVEGDSITTTNLRLVLVPDPARWNIGLEAAGEVASSTSSSRGPATFYQNGVSFFRARKRVLVDRRGIRLQNSEAAANANNNLDDFETDFDGVPLLSGLARAIARNQYQSAQPAAKVEVEGKIVWRATSQLDREVAQKLEQAKRDFQTRMIDPLRKLDLEPTAVDMETTAERLIARYRLAGRDQMAAHTPRPQAPGDSLLSVQIHESALNNVLEHLKLHGQRIELRQLYQDMTERFNRGEKIAIPEDLPEDVYVTFADEDPVRVDCQDGRVRLQIRLKELVQLGSKNRWTNFTVRGYYSPLADQLDANLQREGAIELIGDGEHLRIGDRLALSGIFGKVLNRNRRLNLVNKQIAQAPELTDQQVTQFVIHDGWIGVALGPKSPGREVAMSPRPALRTKTE
jgi:hypothetical protein